MTEDNDASATASDPVVDEHPRGALSTAAAASISLWVGWRVAPIFEHKLALMFWVGAVSLAAGGFVYCVQRAAPFLMDEAAFEDRRRRPFEVLSILSTEPYAAHGRKWVRGAWFCGLLAAVLWLATGVLSD